MFSRRQRYIKEFKLFVLSEIIFEKTFTFVPIIVELHVNLMLNPVMNPMKNPMKNPILNLMKSPQLTRFAWSALTVSCLLLAFSCTSKSERDGDGVGHKPASKGQPFEMVVIIPEQLYVGEVKDSLDEVLRCSTPVLPQHEPLFRLNMVWSDGNLTTWRTFRERFVVELNRRAARPDIGVARNAIAIPQLEVRVVARSTHELAVLLGQQKERLRDLFVEHELDYMADNLRRKYSRSTAEALQALANHTICVPPGLKASKQAKDFLWTGTNLNDRDQNFIFYTYPWDGRPLSPEQFVAKRDSALRTNIPGSRPDQWMQTSRLPAASESSTSDEAASTPSAEVGTAVSSGASSAADRPLILARTRTLNNYVVQEVHGLWELHNGALGGAFVSVERIDTAAQLVLVTEGFIYSPHSPKRNIMREMEAALRTFE